MRKGKRNLLVPITVAGAPLSLMLLSAQVGAAPLPPGPILPVPVAGESELTSFVVGPAVDATIDWMVVPAPAPFPAGAFLYAYQIENTTSVGIDAFTVTLLPGTLPSIVASGVAAGDDLDLPTPLHPGHSTPAGGVDDPAPGAFPILAGEEGPFPLLPVAAPLTTVAPDGTVTWSFAPMAPGTESDTLYFVSTLPPTYNTGVAINSSPPSPFGTLAPGGEPVPVPIPEPMAGLVVLGLAGLTGLQRPRR